MLLYVSENLFTPTLCNSQDIHIWEVLQRMEGESEILRWPTQGHKARTKRPVHQFCFSHCEVGRAVFPSVGANHMRLNGQADC